MTVCVCCWTAAQTTPPKAMCVHILLLLNATHAFIYSTEEPRLIMLLGTGTRVVCVCCWKAAEESAAAGKLLERTLDQQMHR